MTFLARFSELTRLTVLRKCSLQPFLELLVREELERRADPERPTPSARKQDAKRSTSNPLKRVPPSSRPAQSMTLGLSTLPGVKNPQKQSGLQPWRALQPRASAEAVNRQGRAGTAAVGEHFTLSLYSGCVFSMMARNLRQPQGRTSGSHRISPRARMAPAWLGSSPVLGEYMPTQMHGRRDVLLSELHPPFSARKKASVGSI